MDNLPVLPEDVFESGLTAKQERFCFLVSQGNNATEAYKGAKYKVRSDASASANASRLLRNAKVKAFIKYLRQQAINKSIADLTEVKQGLTEIIRTRASNFIKMENGNAHIEADDKALKSAAIAEITTETVKIGGKDSPLSSDITKIKFRDMIPAARLLAELSGWAKPEGTVNVYNDNRQININAREKLFSKLDSIASKVQERTALEQPNGGGS